MRQICDRPVRIDTNSRVFPSGMYVARLSPPPGSVSRVSVPEAYGVASPEPTRREASANAPSAVRNSLRCIVDSASCHGLKCQADHAGEQTRIATQTAKENYAAFAAQ